jgi:hypothetical protein
MSAKPWERHACMHACLRDRRDERAAGSCLGTNGRIPVLTMTGEKHLWSFGLCVSHSDLEAVFPVPGQLSRSN